MTIKIALTGRMGAGKDTVADILNKLLNDNTLYAAFANSLKDFFHTIFPDVPTNPKPREYYQQFGQYMRTIDPDVWIKQLDCDLKWCGTNGFSAIIITDLRQENEYYYCKNNGFHVVEVAAPTELRVKRLVARGDKFSIDDMDHETEQGGFIADSVIYNDGDIEKLRRKVGDILSTLTK
jgi:predicted AAA+ superfamily ATPase